MLRAMHEQCATHVPDAMHERTNELTYAETTHPAREKVQPRNARDVRSHASGLGNWASFDWDSLPLGYTGPRRYRHTGWLYVAEFSFGIVKVGQTIDPKARLQRHAKDATRFRGSLLRFWLSCEHEQWMSNESQALLWCFARGRQTYGEHFADLNFADVIAFTGNLIHPLAEEASA